MIFVPLNLDVLRSYTPLDKESEYMMAAWIVKHLKIRSIILIVVLDIFIVVLGNSVSHLRKNFKFEKIFKAMQNCWLIFSTVDFFILGNGKRDCGNGSDEKACLQLAPSSEAAAYVHPTRVNLVNYA